MKYLSRTGATTYFATTKKAYLAGLIGWAQTMDRLVALRGMCAPLNPAAVLAPRILHLEQWDVEDEWQYDGDSLSDIRSPGNSPLASKTEVRPPSPEDADDAEPPFLPLYPSARTGLAAWEFHQYDDDFFPSIPHGHWQSRPQPKLVPYQGWVYRGTRQIGREPKKNIIALWNDRTFRDFATIAIDYYLHHPHFNGWRVPNPRRLPRRR